jgi:hypothetical protein
MLNVSHRSIRLFIFGMMLVPLTARAAETGVLEKTFTERSPLSSVKELQLRLKQKKLEPDYDLSQQPFIVCVPPQYDAAKPAGIFLLFNYKESSPPNDAVQSFLAEHNLIFVTAKGNQQEPWVKCSLGLDAVHNIAKQYTIDPQRVYLFDFDQTGGGQLLALSFPDVITGSFICNSFQWWKVVPKKGTTGYAPKTAPPSQTYLGKAKLHPLIIATTASPEEDEYPTLVSKAAAGEGFKHLKSMKVTIEQVHYPNFTTDWMLESLQFLDDNNRPSKTSATPATRPPAN